MTDLQRRLLRLKEKVQPNAKPLVNAAKERVSGFQVTMRGYPRKSVGIRS